MCIRDRVSGYPDVKSALDAILLEADEIIVKPFETKKLADLVHDKLLSHKASVSTPKERVAGILQHCTSLIVEDWLAKVKKSKELSYLSLSDEERTGYLPKLIEDLIVRLRAPHNPGEESESIASAAAVAHGKMRKLQGYTPVSYTHLDVYKRQSFPLSRMALNTYVPTVEVALFNRKPPPR